MAQVMEEKAVCPHCGQKLNKWSTPTFNFSDGLGWCSSFLYVCFNDECTFFKNSWKHMYESYGQEMGYRYMLHPDSGEAASLPCGSKYAMKGDIIDEIQEAQEKADLEARKKAFQALTDYFIAKDVDALLKVLMDEEGFGSVRLKAAEHLGEIGDLKAVEPLANYRCVNEVIQAKIGEAVQKIHKKNFTMECPYCAEVIKVRAKICKHCGKELTA
ncbi:MAG: zinc ribbon domain-containing protein [Nitrospiraceae bacterium]|nr:zinc ribbon domain-containing protein [Nitrospiraceae bacterium]